MLKKTLIGALYQPWRTLASRRLSTSSSSVESIILRSLKKHYLEVYNMTPPPKVNPPSQFTILLGALDTDGPVLKRTYKDEEISISAKRMANFVGGGGGDGEGEGEEEEQDDEVNQVFLKVEVAKPGLKDCLELSCGLYPDALGIYSVDLLPKHQTLADNGDDFRYRGLDMRDISDRMRDGFHIYAEERGINEDLFPFLQAWLYVKEHRNLTRWFQQVGTTFVN